MYRNGYCRNCSADRSDERILIFLGDTIECTFCGNILVGKILPEDPRFVFHETLKEGVEIHD